MTYFKNVLQKFKIKERERGGEREREKERDKSKFSFTWLSQSQVKKRLNNLAVQPPSLKKYKKRNFGFTLIELLIVIAIIGLLSSVVLASLNSARKKARDARRIADFRNIGLAMELYFDKYNRYPTSPNNCCSGGPGGTHNQNFEAVANALITEGFLTSVPKDPSDAYMLYDYGGGNVIGEILITYLENIDPTTVPPFNSCRPFDQNWCSNTSASTAYCMCHPY